VQDPVEDVAHRRSRRLLEEHSRPRYGQETQDLIDEYGVHISLHDELERYKAALPSSATRFPLEPDLIPVDKRDNASIKKILDDTVKNVMVNKVANLQPMRLIDGRLAICGMAIFAAIGIFLTDLTIQALGERGLSSPILIVCMGGYACLAAALAYNVAKRKMHIIMSAVERDPNGRKPDSMWEASSQMKRLDVPVYELTLVFENGSTKRLRKASFDCPCTDFYHDNGLLCKDLIKLGAKKLIHTLQSY